jgi:hypothetical protein
MVTNEYQNLKAHKAVEEQFPVVMATRFPNDKPC